MGAVLDPEFQRVHAKLLADLVDDRFRSEGRGRHTRGAVGGGFGFVDHHVVSFDSAVGDLVGSQNALTGLNYGRARETAGFVHHSDVRCGDHPLFVGADLHTNKTTRGWAGCFKYLGAGHGNLHWAPRFLGERGGHRLQVDNRLSSEASADLHGHYLDLGNRYAKDQACEVPNLKMALAAAPNGQFSVFAPHRGGGVGFDITLMHGGGPVLPFHYDVCFFEPFFSVAQLKDEMVGDIRSFPRIIIVAQSTGTDIHILRVGQAFVQNRGIVFHGLDDVGHGRQDLVIHVNQCKCLFRYLQTGRCHCRYGVAFV